MKKVVFLFFVLSVFLLSSCGILIKTSKYQFADGYYTSKTSGKKYSRIYINNQSDTVSSYPLKKENKNWIIDKSLNPIAFPQTNKEPIPAFVFIQPSFDFDVLTILFKYRPETEGFPNQINANFNGVLYFGFRNDLYHIKYKVTPFTLNRNITHYGFSFGAFTGFGATAMNPSVAKNLITNEYDGVVFTKGIAAIAAVGNLSIGLTLGFDNLIDKNNGFWIYENKPWIGLAFGLNLN